MFISKRPSVVKCLILFKILNSLYYKIFSTPANLPKSQWFKSHSCNAQKTQRDNDMTKPGWFVKRRNTKLNFTILNFILNIEIKCGEPAKFAFCKPTLLSWQKLVHEIFWESRVNEIEGCDRLSGKQWLIKFDRKNDENSKKNFLKFGVDT
jgi:hypothetical protein